MPREHLILRDPRIASIPAATARGLNADAVRLLGEAVTVTVEAVVLEAAQAEDKEDAAPGNGRHGLDVVQSGACRRFLG
jgi:hypothetical protein